MFKLNALCSFSDPLMNPQPNRIGSMFRKAIMKQWTDRTFSTEIPPEPWMGFVGPLLKGETGDVLYVHFKNSASRAYGLHPHGVQYFKDSEGITCVSLCKLSCQKYVRISQAKSV